MVVPPSNVQVCSREYFPLRKSGLVRFQEMVARYSDMTPTLAPPPFKGKFYHACAMIIRISTAKGKAGLSCAAPRLLDPCHL